MWSVAESSCGRFVFAVLALVSASCALEEHSSAPEPHALALTVDPPIVISQLYGGGGNSGAPFTHDFVELFNRSNAPVALDDLSLQYTSATGTGNFGASASQIATFPTGATLDAGRYYLIQLALGAGTGVRLSAPDQTAAISVSATAGKLALVTGTTTLGCNGANTPCDAAQTARILDLVGFGSANFFETAAVPALSNTTAASRREEGCRDTNDNRADFEVGPPVPRNVSTVPAPCGGDRAPFVASTVPRNGAARVSPSVAVQITFSEPVSAADGWFAFTCDSGAVTATVSGGPTTYTLMPANPLGEGERCTVAFAGGLIADLDADDPPDAMPIDYVVEFTIGAVLTPIAVHTVQGAAHLSPYVGQTVNVGSALVTAIRATGFFMQDVMPDADDATSEGIFVFTDGPAGVAVGDEVTVVGTIAEHRPGCSPSCPETDSAFDNLTTTEIDDPSVSVLSTGHALPSAVALGSGAGERRVPLKVIADDAEGSVEAGGAFDPDRDGIDFYESLESMRVQLERPEVVDPTRVFSDGTSLEIGVIARADAELRTARGGLVIRADDANPERVFLSNAIVATFPTVDVGDGFDGAVVGVLDYSFANYKLLVTEALPAVTRGGLLRETTSLAPQSASQLTIASMNVENLDALDPAAKFEELADIVVTALGAPDLVALEEVQDDNGAADNGVVSASATLARFAEAIGTAGGPVYEFRQIDPVDNQDGGEPGGNIRVVLMLRIDRGLAFVDRGAAAPTTANRVDTTPSGPRLALSPGRIAPSDPAFTASRKPLAGELTFNGQPLFVIANHFNSKGGDDPLFGRFQPPVLASEPQRIAQATLVAGFVESIFAADPGARVVVLGDLNDFSFSPPLDILRETGLEDLGQTLPPSERYTYVYQGNSQALDHILVSPSLFDLASYDIVHVNAEFAQQASDHDPSIVRVETELASHCR